MDVQISNNLDPLTKENMMDMTFETTVMSADGTTATGTCTLADIASWTTGTAPDSITARTRTSTLPSPPRLPRATTPRCRRVP